MMKAKIACFLLLAFFLAGCDNTPQNASQQKTCVVDLARLMRESAPGKEGMKFIESLQQDMQKELDVLNDKLEKNPQDAEAMQQLQAAYTLSQQRFQAEAQNVASQVLDVVQRELNLFREQNGYAYIIANEALNAYDPKLDMTNEVLKSLENQKTKFKISQTAMPDTAQTVQPGNIQGQSQGTPPIPGNAPATEAPVQNTQPNSTQKKN